MLVPGGDSTFFFVAPHSASVRGCYCFLRLPGDRRSVRNPFLGRGHHCYWSQGRRPTAKSVGPKNRRRRLLTEGASIIAGARKEGQTFHHRPPRTVLRNLTVCRSCCRLCLPAGRDRNRSKDLSCTLISRPVLLREAHFFV